MKTIGALVLVGMGFDIIIVLWMMLALRVGQEVSHIPFWDAQVRFIVHIFA